MKIKKCITARILVQDLNYGKSFFKREKATSLLKEVSKACNGSGEPGIMLMSPDADDILSHGYQLPVKHV